VWPSVERGLYVVHKSIDILELDRNDCGDKFGYDNYPRVVSTMDEVSVEVILLCFCMSGESSGAMWTHDVSVSWPGWYNSLIGTEISGWWCGVWS
jgi:hypothetical protein